MSIYGMLSATADNLRADTAPGTGPPPGETLIFQSNEASKSIGAVSPGIFDTAHWGPSLSDFNAPRHSIQTDPAGGGAKCYRLEYRSDDTSATCARRFVDVHNGGADMINIALEAEFYFPDPSPTRPNAANGGESNGEDLKMLRILGHDFNQASQRTVVNDPSASLDAHYQGSSPIKDQIGAYCYHVTGGAGSFGSMFDYGPAFSTNVWTKIRVECRAGSGSPDGSMKLYKNDMMTPIGQETGIQWHTTPGFGWRHVSFTLDSQVLLVNYFVYIKNVKIFDLTG